jgi:hypothetical protein
MTFLKWTGLSAIAFVATSLCTAQQKFPLRPGEWNVTMSAAGSQNAPMVLPFCLNDETWQKALNQNPSCTVQQFTTTSTGTSYTLDCNTKTYQMSGKVKITFDGMEHMIANSSIDMTMNGKITHLTSQVDYRWKGATCSPNDMNLRPRKTP